MTDLGLSTVTTLTDFFKHSKDAFFILDGNFVITYVNPQTEKLFASVKEKMVGRTIGDVFTASGGSLSFGRFSRAVKDGKSENGEIFCASLGRWLEVKISPIDNDIAGLLLKDITETVKIRKTLHTYEERYKAFIHASFDMIY